MIKRIRFYKGDKTFHITETTNPDLRLKQLQRQHELRGDGKLAWTLLEGVLWDEWDGKVKPSKSQPKRKKKITKK